MCNEYLLPWGDIKEHKVRLILLLKKKQPTVLVECIFIDTVYFKLVFKVAFQLESAKYHGDFRRNVD